MNYSEQLADLMKIPGLIGAALVEGKTGMVIAEAGQLPNMSHIAESAVEFWRIHWRLNIFFSEEFGHMRQQVCFFEGRVLALIPWDKNSDWVWVFVGKPSEIDWGLLHKQIKK